MIIGHILLRRRKKKKKGKKVLEHALGNIVVRGYKQTAESFLYKYLP